MNRPYSSPRDCDSPHGTNYRYTWGGCRCKVTEDGSPGCSPAHNEAMRAYRQERKARTGERIVHGRFVKP